MKHTLLHCNFGDFYFRLDNNNDQTVQEDKRNAITEQFEHNVNLEEKRLSYA